MDFNSFIFPAPKRARTQEQIESYLIWVPVYEKKVTKNLKVLQISSNTSSAHGEPTKSLNMPRTPLQNPPMLSKEVDEEPVIHLDFRDNRSESALGHSSISNSNTRGQEQLMVINKAFIKNLAGKRANQPPMNSNISFKNLSLTKFTKRSANLLSCSQISLGGRPENISTSMLDLTSVKERPKLQKMMFRNPMISQAPPPEDNNDSYLATLASTISEEFQSLEETPEQRIRTLVVGHDHYTEKQSSAADPRLPSHMSTCFLKKIDNIASNQRFVRIKPSFEASSLQGQACPVKPVTPKPIEILQRKLTQDLYRETAVMVPILKPPYDVEARQSSKRQSSLSRQERSIRIGNSMHKSSYSSRLDAQESEALNSSRSSIKPQFATNTFSSVLTPSAAIKSNPTPLAPHLLDLDIPQRVKTLGPVKLQNRFRPDALDENNADTSRSAVSNFEQIRASKSKYSHKVSHCIPCIAIHPFEMNKQPRRLHRDDKLLIYFHGNAEDLEDIAPLCRQLAYRLQVSVLAPEYPGYGLYEGQATEKQILEDSEALLEFITREFQISLQNVIIIGRSIGTGPATHLASCERLGGLLLISPFTSISDVIRDKFGVVVSLLVKQRFSNIDKIGRVNCRVHIVHGAKDELVPVLHAQKLIDAFNKPDNSKLFLLPEMDHGLSDIFAQLIVPLLEIMGPGRSETAQ